MTAAAGTIRNEAAERFRDYLREKGLRLTPERLELLRVVLATPAHFDADDLVRRLRRRGRRVSRATAYRTLTLLEHCGILRKSLLGQGRSLYETALGRGHHDHIVCAACGRIEEFFEPQVEELQETIAARLGFTILDHVHELFGHCADCRNGGGAGGREADRDAVGTQPRRKERA